MNLQFHVLPLSMILIAFNISHTQNIKGHSGSEKHIQILYKTFISQMHNLDKSTMQ